MDEERVSTWVGWIYFAGVVMITVGIFHAISGFVALFRNEVILSGVRNVWLFDLTTWGWTYLLTGLLILFGGFGVIAGSTWGRVIAVLAAIWSAIVNFAFIPVYPFWSILMIVIDLVIIYAVVAHGSELRLEE